MLSYWASGLEDMRLMIDTARAHGVEARSWLDLGCASGRMLRHVLHAHPEIRAIGCDINRWHAEWFNAHLPGNGVFFQSSSMPSLPLEDNSVDLVSAYSVFTHIESPETAWLMELRRVRRPGGLAWITVHTEFTLQDMRPDWPLRDPVMKHPEAATRLDEERGFEGDRLVLRWLNDRSYASNVFYRQAYLEAHWGWILDLAEVRRRHPSFQDVLILRNP